MQKIVKQSIEIYNNERPHFSCNYFTPKQMHLQQSVEIKTYKKAKPAECLTADS
jgi:transposase InsO family protein